MLQSKLFGSTRKSIAEEEVSSNAQFLTRGGFIEKTMAGVYTILPLGLRVIKKISGIVRDEMDAAGGQELLMPAFQPKEFWQKTGRWDTLDVLFKVKSGSDKEYALGPTHEEVVTPTAQSFINSYRDLPKYVYQIQTKFRDEPRAKSGILRGREFIMKDLYSFHTSEEDLDSYYEIMQGAYKRVFERMSLNALEVYASGGSFSKYSHEYQVLTEAGEDEVYWCPCGFAQNKEIVEVAEGDTCPSCKKEKIQMSRGVEVGNIFKLMTKYSGAFDFNFMDETGTPKPVLMGCYGIGISRLMGTLVEVHHDDRGIIWPSTVAPFDVHIIPLGGATEERDALVQEVRQLCKANGKDVLIDDRGLSAGASLGDADLIGIPLRVVVSAKSIAAGGIEVKRREEAEAQILSLEAFESSL